MEKKTADISILAANYNNGRYLNDFITSILDSEVLPARIIIVDDGSSDNSQEILHTWESHSRTHFLFLPDNEGFGHALNHGLDLVDTKYIMRADPDDIFLPQRIGKQVNFLESHPELSGVGCNVEYFHSESGKTLIESNFPLAPDAVCLAYERGEHGMQHPSVTLRASAMAGFRYKQENVPAEDYDLFARMVAAGHRFGNLPEVLYRMRIHTASASSNIRFSTIRKTYALREEIFGQKTSILRQRMYFYHIFCYRRGLLDSNPIRKTLWFGISVFFYPGKLLRRILASQS